MVSWPQAKKEILMGTRHLVAVQLDGEFKVAQYGQWDGYPEGQGKEVLRFLRSRMFRGNGRSAFEEKLRAAKFLTEEENSEMNLDVRSSGFFALHPEWSRDTGAKILSRVAEAEPGIRLVNASDFAGDSLFCEWAYVIDLDKDMLEVYRGFNRRRTSKKARFFSDKPNDSGHYPVRLVAKYPLSSLPSLAKMVGDCDKELV
jgi:hypothetical protein